MIRFLPVLLLVAASAWSLPSPAPQVASFREGLRLSVPVLDDALIVSCQARAHALAEEGVLSHRDRYGRGPGEQLTAEGQLPGTFGEVLGAGRSLDEVWKAWMESPTHRAILEEPGWTTWGWGTSALGSTQVWVLRFRKP